MVALAVSEKESERPSRWRQRWAAFRNPIVEEKARVLRERWDSLPVELQTNNQISGRHLTHCGFTLGASYCSFHCTHCYLPKNANSIPIPSLAQVKEQVEAARAALERVATALTELEARGTKLDEELNEASAAYSDTAARIMVARELRIDAVQVAKLAHAEDRKSVV